MNNLENVKILEHPLIAHKLTILRNVETGSKEFRELIEEITLLLGYEATRDFPLCEVPVKTPLVNTTGKKLKGKKPAIIPILRAGLGMVEGMVKLLPTSKIGHIGLYRDHDTHLPIEYYCNLPDNLGERMVIVVDPMLATGGSGSDAITMLKKHGCKDIRFLCIIAAPEGVKKLQKDHPDIKIFCASLDEKLNENCYIIPGLGDAGDRIFGTI